MDGTCIVKTSETIENKKTVLNEYVRTFSGFLPGLSIKRTDKNVKFPVFPWRGLIALNVLTF
jgi:hypothetical protein